MAQQDEYNLESGQAGVVSPCSSVVPVDPPAHLYQATSVAVAPVAIGTTLPVSASTTGNVTTFGFQIPQGQPGIYTTVLLPSATFPTVSPNAGYRCIFSWSATTQGQFAPFAFFDAMTNDRAAEFNRNAAACSNAQQGWSVMVPPAAGGGYTPAPMTISGAQLIGMWTAAPGGPPVVNNTVTIAGAWTLVPL